MTSKIKYTPLLPAKTEIFIKFFNHFIFKMDDINELINFNEREKYVGNVVCGRYDFLVVFFRRIEIVWEFS